MPRIIVRETAAELPSDASALGGLFEGDIAFALNTDVAYYWNGTFWEQFTSGQLELTTWWRHFMLMGG